MHLKGFVYEARKMWKNLENLVEHVFEVNL